MSDVFNQELEERLVRYVQIDTTSDDASKSTPSTDIQFDLLRLLVDELNEIGAQDVTLTDYGAVLATIPVTTDNDALTIAYLAHVNTSAQFSGTNVKPVVHRNYDGSDITFPDNPELVLSPKDSPYLAGRIGEDIITASGTTLLTPPAGPPPSTAHARPYNGSVRTRFRAGTWSRA